MVGMQVEAPNSTAVRVALWRALHVHVDSAPHVFEDEMGLQLAAPDSNWHSRPDMNPEFTRLFRASIVARARFVEDLLQEQIDAGIAQYVILGSGLDTFAQRKPEVASKLRIFEIDQPAHQDWKKHRLSELGLSAPDYLKLVSVDFEAGESWLEKLISAGFDINQPAVVACTGVTMYLGKDTIAEMLRQMAKLVQGTTLAMTFLLPIELATEEERKGFEASKKGAQASGTPFVSFFAPEEMLTLACESGCKDVQCVSGEMLGQRYFANRSDKLHPGNAEAILVAKT